MGPLVNLEILNLLCHGRFTEPLNTSLCNKKNLDWSAY